jgi:protein-L-isoaspartate(D-aspartate) O-methyltransferase
MRAPDDVERLYAERRRRMVEEQLCARGIGDPRVLRVMGEVPRHRFVPHALWDHAYDDTPLPIGHAQTISQPYIVALMTERLALSGWERVLEVGTGSGYQAAVLARLTREVFTLERIAPLAEEAAGRLRDLGFKNVQVFARDGRLGLPESAPFDRIIVTAAAPAIPPALIEQLAEEGILAAPVGDPGYVQTLVLGRKVHGRLQSQSLVGCLFVPLLGDVEQAA